MYPNNAKITACHLLTKPESYKPDRKNNQLVLLQLLAFIQITVHRFLLYIFKYIYAGRMGYNSDG